MSMMIDKIDQNQIQELIGNKPSRLPNHSEQSLPSLDEGASLQADYTAMINKAIEKAQQNDVNTVERAKELLASGKLESPDNFREAAESILKFGI